VQSALELPELRKEIVDLNSNTAQRVMERAQKDGRCTERWTMHRKMDDAQKDGRCTEREREGTERIGGCTEREGVQKENADLMRRIQARVTGGGDSAGV
jgi:uncharacterized membrane protein